MPFGLDLKSIIVGLALAYFILPWVMSMFSRKSAPAAAA
jgi:hypothetical protein